MHETLQIALNSLWYAQITLTRAIDNGESMKGLRTEFYADWNDMSDFLSDVAVLEQFCFTSTVSAVNRELVSSLQPRDLLNFTVLPSRPERTGGFVVTDRSTKIVPRELKMTDGSGTRLTLDRYNNPDCARISLGGDAGDQTLVASILDTSGETEHARRLYATLKKFVTKRARRVSGQLIMPGALEKLLAGWRLTAGKSYHRGLDVTRPDR